MLTIEIPPRIIKGNPTKVFSFLSDMNNIQQLMPEQVINWKSTADECSYTIKGMADISMRVANRVPSTELLWESFGKVPFDFKLKFDIQPDAENAIASLRFDGEVNPFLKMMVEKPLRNFFGMLVEGLDKIDFQ
jgi:carbon monoxide dehydrogenase subunit G